MKKIILALALGMLFIGCEPEKRTTFDCYFESGITPVKFQIDTPADTITVKKANIPVSVLAISEPTSDTTHAEIAFKQNELLKPVKSNFTEVTISSDQIKIVVKENDAPYDRKIWLDFTGPGVSDHAVMTIGTVEIIQKAKL